MLELKKIVKDYVSGNNVTHALKGISVNFRKNEFVSILGASGCGKTTTLNIIGGLDRYTSGDLLINGKSTKKYTDRDWDTYRNHSVGFIFQSYNLISHQNILKNVELALTISGVQKQERKERALKALEIVGLKGMEKKKPNQLSGGQCQRVAIARALINNPEILLADEPTGALDSETSVQIMNLLKEVAKDRLVIMVTHNPDLAEKYSTRIITMSDGVLLSDSNPFDGNEKIEKNVVNKGNKKKSSMSVLTAAGLSVSNLFSKLRRTILVTIAGSIGIIGVSAVLAVSQGVKDYVASMQNDMLSYYPLKIAEESVDLTSLMTGLSTSEASKAVAFNPTTEVGVDSMINYLMTTYSGLTNVKTNTINQQLMNYLDNMPQEALSAVYKNYGIDPTNNIFGKWVNDQDDAQSKDVFMSFNGLTQRYIAELETVDGFSEYASYVDLFTSFMHELPNNADYINEQYDVIAGDPLSLKEDELVFVVDKETTLTDLVLAQTGFYSHNQFIDIAKCAIEENDYKSTEEYEELSSEEKINAINRIRDNYDFPMSFSYEKILNSEFYYFPQNEIYFDSDNVADDEITYSVSFVITDSNNELERLVSLSYRSLYGYNVLYGNTVYKNGEAFISQDIACVQYVSGGDSEVEDESKLNGIWLAFDVNELVSLFKNKADATELIARSLFTFELNSLEESRNQFYIGNDAVPFKPSYNVTRNPITGFEYSAELDSSYINDLNGHQGKKLRIATILRRKESKQFGCLSKGLYYSKAFGDKYMSDSINGNLTNALKEHMNNKSTKDSQFNAYVKFDYFDYKKNEKARGYASSLNGDLSTSFSDLFSGLTGVNYAETNAVHLRSLSGLKMIGDDYEGYSFEQLPMQISIYPKDFNAKKVITDYLDRWNDDEGIIEGLKQSERDLTYTDTIEVIITVIDILIETITIALVAFSSLSLVVSCFMIAVITYISVVERIKEIGVIRSLGGRKGDVANLFIMETLFTGLFSGTFGILVTYLFQIIFNACLLKTYHITMANLTPLIAILMILVSVVLSVVSGLIPSQSAARKDPVVALRSNE